MTKTLIGDATKFRIFAASVDNLLAMFGALFTASSLPGLPDSDRVGVAVATYLTYFWIQESIWSNTVGKRVFGLCIRQLNGARCGFWPASIRTATRVVEANPLIGGLPAALLGAFSKRHQRLGDMLSGCVVIRASEVPLEHGALDALDGGGSVD